MGVLARCEGLRNGLAAKEGEPGPTPPTLTSSVTLAVSIILIGATVSMPINIMMVPATNFSLKENRRVNYLLST